MPYIIKVMKSELVCDHCGEEIIGRNKYTYNSKSFCCSGCKTVYQLLVENDMGTFYQLEDKSGVKPKNSQQHKYDFLEVPEIRSKFVDFEDDKYVKTTLYLPEIHCSSCIYLLENLARILPGVTSSQVDFIQKEALITFKKEELKYAELASFLEKIGYAPNFGNRNEQSKKIDKVFFYKLGVAGFAFGSIMLWSVPDYSKTGIDDHNIQVFTSILTFILSVPVLLFSARDYFISAFKAIRSKNLNLDVPITIGITALYAQSVYTMITDGSAGYMDSFAGFIFFLLIGKWFQNRTYRSLSFERDYTSYFPVAVTRVLADGKEEFIEIEKIKVGETILMRNEEVIPCDSILVSDTAKIDYSFVTGESKPIYKKKGDFIYAGGKLLGQKSYVKAKNTSNRSLLTQLWNDIKVDKEESNRFKFQDIVAKYFLIAVFIIAAIAGIVWAFIDLSRVTEIIVAVLIVACPCALALSSPFTFGNVMKVMGRKGIYLKNSLVVERMAEITDIVFDKTGTLTESIKMDVKQEGDTLSKEEKEMIYSLANSSTHPLSRAIVHFLYKQGVQGEFNVENYEEQPGLGLKGKIKEQEVLLGSYKHLFQKERTSNETETFLKIGDKTGRFVFQSKLREGVSGLLNDLSNYTVHILSGDKDKDKELMTSLVGSPETIYFNQDPNDKLRYIQKLQNEGKKVLMVGDGLNDAGALGIAHVGVAVSEDMFRFVPSSDAIIQADELKQLNHFLDLSHFAQKVLKASMIFSITYNTIGLSFAVLGYLTPLVAAILMPLSSISVVALSTFLVHFKR